MIVLSSGELRVKQIIKPTNAKFFREWRAGDSITIFHTLRSSVGASGGGLYSSEFKVINYTRDISAKVSGNNLINRLASFEMEVL